MHALALVFIPADGPVMEHVERLMSPHQEDWEPEPHTGWWDWWQIGGRFTGILDGYKPAEDPANTETCFLCGGSGKRPDMEVVNGCIGCAGVGTRQKWPTKWKTNPGDVQPATLVTELGDLHNCWAVVTEDGAATRDGRDGDGHWRKVSDGEFASLVEALAPSIDPSGRVVVVDFHS